MSLALFYTDSDLLKVIQNKSFSILKCIHLRTEVLDLFFF
jgi:hypothetical protein